MRIRDAFREYFTVLVIIRVPDAILVLASRFIACEDKEIVCSRIARFSNHANSWVVTIPIPVYEVVSLG